jgi:uncharacterized protein
MIHKEALRSGSVFEVAYRKMTNHKDCKTVADHNPLNRKKKRVQQQFQDVDSLAVAFSGGVDSSLLLALAREVLGDRVVAMTAVSSLMPRREVDEAVKLAGMLGVSHRLVRVEGLFVGDFTQNSANRCYICKKILFSQMFESMLEESVTCMAHGANADDMADFRPGMQAAEEMGVLAPLRDAGLTKAEIREMARQAGLSNWDRPAAACLASRIPYGMEITHKRLEMIEIAENTLTALGFSGFRVRHLGDTAKLELRPAEFDRLLNPERRLKIVSALRRAGFDYVTMDLEGYGTGRMNRSLS